MVKSADIYVIELEESTATVSQAAEALGVEPGRIAKTMSFLQGEQPVLILTERTAKIDNRKYKDTFHVKAKMIPFEEVEEMVGGCREIDSSETGRV